MNAFQLSGHATDLAFAVVIAISYIAVLRLVDLNEKEPLWAIGLLFGFGAAACVMLHLLVSSPSLRLNIWLPSIAEETARLTAILPGAAALWAVGQMRGWREIGGTMDGIVYGAAAGLGFATARILIDRIILAGTLGPEFLPGLERIVTTALMEFRDGLFGGLIGAGVGAAAGSAALSRRIGFPLLGWIAAIVVHAAYLGLIRNATGVPPQARLWLALLLPFFAVAALISVALKKERSAIGEHLSGEESFGSDELAALRSLRARTARSLRALANGDYQRWAGDRTLQNRLVQLALVKQQQASERDPARQRALEREAVRIRAAAAVVRHALDIHGAAATKGRL